MTTLSGSPAETLCSDSERDAIAATLRDEAIAGRLEPAELEERLGRALSSRTRGELDATLEDLPIPASRPRSADEERPSRAPWSATAAVVAVLAIMLWLTGHLGRDGMMFVVAGAILLVIWRRP